MARRALTRKMVSTEPIRSSSRGPRTGQRIRDLPIEAARLAREQGRRNAGVGQPVRSVEELFAAKTVEAMNGAPFGELPKGMTPDLMAEFARNVRKYQRAKGYHGMEGGPSQPDWAYEDEDTDKGDYEFYYVPAKLTKIPMGTSNRKRPRVVAAGYNEHASLLTVVFRDGTYYNYYDVDQQDWDAFRAAPSTKMWIGGWEGGGSKRRKRTGTLDRHPRGVAETGLLDPAAEQVLHSISRATSYGRRA